MKNFYLVSNNIFDLKLSASEFYVLNYLLRCVNRTTGMCFPSKWNISSSCCLSESTVSRAIKSLQEKGLIEINNNFKGGRQLSNHYHILTGGLYQNRPRPLSNSDTEQD